MDIRVLRSPADSHNPDIVEVIREGKESNLDWIKRILAEKLAPSGEGSTLLLLVGGNDPLSFRLRVAQSPVRHDLSPSAWSHVLLISELKADLGDSPTVEVSLAPPSCFGKFGYAVLKNGIQYGELRDYEKADHFPNIALLSAPKPVAHIFKTLKSLELQRSVLDVPQLIIKWLTFGWGVGTPVTPLAEGAGMPGAALLEAAFAANGFDLTPGLESRSSCPEAIWQAAYWWHSYYATVADRAMEGAFSAKHDLVPDSMYGTPPGEEPPSPSPRGAPQARGAARRATPVRKRRA